MHEVKKPKKNLAYYYLIVLIVIMLFNAFVYPYIIEQQVKEVDYGTFMSMTEKGKIGQVEIQSNQIIFTNKDNTKIYKTGLMDDPDYQDIFDEEEVLKHLPQKDFKIKIKEDNSTAVLKKCRFIEPMDESYSFVLLVDQIKFVKE